jgi:hypothetical protein
VKQLDSPEFYTINQLNETLSVNVFFMRGIAYTPDTKETVSQTEKVILQPSDLLAQSRSEEFLR